MVAMHEKRDKLRQIFSMPPVGGQEDIVWPVTVISRYYCWRGKKPHKQNSLFLAVVRKHQN